MMKQNSPGEHRTKTLLGLLSLSLLLALLLTGFGGNRFNITATNAASDPSNASANAAQALPRRPWTAVGSTGAVDEASLSTYAFNGAEFGFKSPGAGSVIVARYNVTNTFDNNANPNMPNWTNLEMGSTSPINCLVSATLYRVKVCSRDPVAICTIVNRSGDHPCGLCQFPSSTFDFGGYLYYVEVKLDRTSAPAAAPTVYTLRVY